MTSRKPSNPVVHRLVDAINDGDRDAFLATLTPLSRTRCGPIRQPHIRCTMAQAMRTRHEPAP